MPKHTGAMIALVVPSPESYAIDPSVGEATPADELHITLAYLGEAADISPDQRDAIVNACQALAESSHAPQALFPASTGMFPPDPEGFADADESAPAPYWAAPSNTEAFNELREDLMVHLSARGVAELVSTKHPVFQPHVTLTYAPVSTPPDLSYLPYPTPVRFSKLLLKFGDESYTFDLITPQEGPALPLTSSVRARISELSSRLNISKDLLTALYLQQTHVRSTPAQTRAQAGLEALTASVDPNYRTKSFKRVETLSERAYIETSPEARLFVAHRALALASSTSPASTHEARELAHITASLRTIIADGNSSIARSLRARKQLRDRKGRWIEMGGGVRFKVRVKGVPGGGKWQHGTVVGLDTTSGKVHVKLEDGRTVAVPNTKLEQPKAIIGMNLGKSILDKASKFKPKSQGRKGKATLPTDPDQTSEASKLAQDDTALSALEKIQGYATPEEGKVATGGHLVRLAVEASNSPELDDAIDNGSDSFSFTGVVSPFKGVSNEFSVTDIQNVRDAYDRRVAELMPSQEKLDSLTDEQIKKVIQGAQSSAIGNLAGLFNDRLDKEAKELRQAPSAGADEDLEVVETPATPDDNPTAEESVEAIQDALKEFNELVPDSSSRAAKRDRINDLLNTAAERYLNGQDSVEEFNNNLARVKEFANAQEGFFGQNATIPADVEAFSSLAEDLDDIHKANDGSDEYSSAIDAVTSAHSSLESHIETLEQDPEFSGDTSTLDSLLTEANAIVGKIEEGAYLDKPLDLVDDVDSLRENLQKANQDGEVYDEEIGNEILGELTEAADTFHDNLPAQSAQSAEASDTEAPASAPEGVEDEANYPAYPEGVTDPAAQAAWQGFSDASGALFDATTAEDGEPLLPRAGAEVFMPFVQLTDSWIAGEEVSGDEIRDIADEITGALLTEDKFDAAKAEEFQIKAAEWADLVDKMNGIETTSEAPEGPAPVSPAHTAQGFFEVSQNIKNLAEQATQGATKIAADTASNIVSNVGKFLARGDISADSASQYLESAHQMLENAKNGESPEFADNIQTYQDMLPALLQEADVPAPDPTTARSAEIADGYDSLTAAQQNDLDAKHQEFTQWVFDAKILLESWIDDEINETALGNNLDVLADLSSAVNEAYDNFTSGQINAEAFKDDIDGAVADYGSEFDQNAIPMDDEDGIFDPEDATQALMDSFLPSDAPASVPNPEDPWETVPGPAAQAAQNYLISSEAPEELKEEFAGEAGEAAENLSNALDTIAGGSEDSDALEAAIEAANTYADMLNDIDSQNDDQEAFLAVQADEAETLAATLSTVADEQFEEELSGNYDQTAVENIIAQLSEQGGLPALATAQHLQGKLDAGIPVTDADVADIKSFFNWIAEGSGSDEVDKAQLTSAADELDYNAPAAPAAPTEQEAETVPEEPAAPQTDETGYNVAGALNTEDALAAWKTALDEYLADHGTSAPLLENYKGSKAWTELSSSQVDNLAKIVEDLDSDVSGAQAKKLGDAVDAHIAGSISDDDLVQVISDVLLSTSASNVKLRKRLAGAQAGIQKNKHALVPILRPKTDAYKTDELTEEDLHLASPEIVKATLAAILQQHADGTDLTGLTDGVQKDEEVKKAVKSAESLLKNALDQFNAGNPKSMVTWMNKALAKYDEAIELRKDVHKQDKVIRRLRARRRALDEVLAAFEGRWPDPIDGGNKQLKNTKSWELAGENAVAKDRKGNLVYPGDRVVRVNKSAQGQLATVVGTSKKSMASGKIKDVILAKLDSHKALYSQGITENMYELQAVGPNNPLYNDPSYTGEKVDTSKDLEQIQKQYMSKAGADYNKETAPTFDAPEETTAPTETTSVKDIIGQELLGNPDITNVVALLPEGSKIVIKSSHNAYDGTWTKDSNNDWIAPDDTGVIASDDFSDIPAATSIKLASLPDEALSPAVEPLADWEKELLEGIEPAENENPAVSDGTMSEVELYEYYNDSIDKSTGKVALNVIKDDIQDELSKGNLSEVLANVLLNKINDKMPAEESPTKGLHNLYMGEISSETDPKALYATYEKYTQDFNDGNLTAADANSLYKALNKKHNELNGEGADLYSVVSYHADIKASNTEAELSQVENKLDNTQVGSFPFTPSEESLLRGFIAAQKEKLGLNETDADDVETQDTTFPGKMEPMGKGQQLVDNLNKLPADTKIFLDGPGGNQGEFVKAGDGTWVDLDTGDVYDAVAFGNDSFMSQVYVIETAEEGTEQGANGQQSEPGPSAGDSLGTGDEAVSNLNKLPAGAVVTVEESSGEVFQWVKQQDGNWLSPGLPNGNSISPELLANPDSVSIELDSLDAQSLWNKSVASADADQAIETVKTYDISTWSKGKAMGGSNGATLYTDPDGNKFVVKPVSGPNFTPSQHTADMEALGSVIYNYLGYKAPEIGFATLPNGKPAVVSSFIDYTPFGQLSTAEQAAAKKKMYENYAIDTWLANYDIIGLGYENFGTDAEGNLVYVDNGGAFDVKAQGDNKAWWGTEAKDYDMWSAGVKPTNSSAWNATIPFYKDITEEQKKESAKKLLEITTEDLHNMVGKIPTMSAAQKAKLVQTLALRRDSILLKAGLNPDDVGAATGPVSTTQAVAAPGQATDMFGKALSPGDTVIHKAKTTGKTINGTVIKSLGGSWLVGYTDENGQNKVTKIAPEKWTKVDAEVPAGHNFSSEQMATLKPSDFVVYGVPDTSSPWYDKPAPIKPESKFVTTIDNPKPLLDQDWYDEAEKMYHTYLEGVGKPIKPLNQSASWHHYDNVIQHGMDISLEKLHSKGKISDALYQQAKDAIAKRNADIAAEAEKLSADLAKWKSDMAAWNLANGSPMLKLPTAADLASLPKEDFSATKKLAHQLITPPSADGYQAISSQKGSSDHNGDINSQGQGGARKVLKPGDSLAEDAIVSNPKINSQSKNSIVNSYKLIKSGKFTVPEGQILRGARTNSFGAFYKKNGEKASKASDFDELDGSLQFDPGMAEMSIGSPEVAGYAYMAGSEVIMNMHLLPGVSGSYTGTQSHTGERGFVIHGPVVYLQVGNKKNVLVNHKSGEQLHGYASHTFPVEVDIVVIPQSLYEQFGHFEGIDWVNNPPIAPVGPSNVPSGPINVPSGPSNVPGGPTNIPGGPTNVPGGVTNG